MNQQELIKQVSGINASSKKGKRSPHKPLLILLTLARIQSGESRLTTFSEIENELVPLLAEFGPLSAQDTPHLPFWHLKTDGIWDIPNPEGVLTGAGKISRKYLRDHNVLGGFTPEIDKMLREESGLSQLIAQQILIKHFPTSIRQDIIDTIGLDFEASLATDTQQKRKRSSEFRKRILEAYSYRCAICGMNMSLENTSIGLEAAHIKWFQAGGPDEENNGLALCVLHHKLLDRGALAIDPDNKVLVSEKAHGNAGFDEWVFGFRGKPLNDPIKSEFRPNPEYTEWHIREVFQSRYNKD